MRIKQETLVPIAIVIGVFVLALILLACSLNSSELLDCSLFRCCWSRRRRRRRRRQHQGGATGLDDDDDDDNPITYTSLNEFIFEAPDEERAGFVNLAMNDIPTETCVQDVFPDILGDSSSTASPRHEAFAAAARGPTEDNDNNNNNSLSSSTKKKNKGASKNKKRKNNNDNSNNLNEPLL